VVAVRTDAQARQWWLFALTRKRASGGCSH
jgi:hypothetical protein